MVQEHYEHEIIAINMHMLIHLVERILDFAHSIRFGVMPSNGLLV